MNRSLYSFAFLLLATLGACKGDNFRLIYEKKSSADVQSGGEPGAWSNDQFLSANSRCVADIGASEKEASSDQVNTFCDCLVTKAREKFSYRDYTSDTNNLRARQAQQGQVDECRGKAGLAAMHGPREWKPQTLFDSDSFSKSSPTVITLPNKKMIMVYGKLVNNQTVLYAVLYDGLKWGAPQAIGENYDYEGPRTSVNSKGQVSIVWAQAQFQPNGDPIPTGIHGALYDPSTGWQPRVTHRAASEIGSVSTYSTFIDDDGNAVVTWTDITDSDTRLYQYNSYMRLYTGGAWQERSLIGDADYLWPTVVITPDKMMHALIGVGNTTTVDMVMYAARVPLALGRFVASDFKPLEQSEGPDVISSQPEMQVDAKGNIAAIWFRGTQAVNFADWKTKTTVANFNAATGKWDVKPNFSSSGTGPVFFTRLAMNASGTAVAAWVQNEGTRQLIWASRYDPAKGWAPPAPIDHNAAVESSAPAVAINGKGEALAVWSKRSLLDDKGWVTMASHFNGFFWSNETTISSKTAGNVTAFASVSLHDDSTGFSFWTQGDGMTEPGTDFMYMAEFK